MYKAQYDFLSNHNNILSFKTGDLFLDFDGVHRNGWIYVINENLRTGYIPVTYIKSGVDVINNECETSFIEMLITKAENRAKETENAQEKGRCIKIIKQLQNKANINELANNVTSLQVMEECELPSNEDYDVHQNSVANMDNTMTVDTSEVLEPVRERSKAKVAEDAKISSSLGCELIEHVHCGTGLGHKQARMAVEATLEFLSAKVPSVKSVTTAILTSIKGASPTSEVLENAHDWQRLRCIFSTILDVKSDIEQLNWALYEDQHIIVEFLEELLNLLTDGDPVVCKHFLQKDQYRNVEALVQYFQMEKRMGIRQVLLKVFAALCTLDRLCITVLVNSDLPLLLARDIQEAQQDHQKLVYSCLVLTMLMWTGDTMPVNHYDVLNASFVNFLLDLMDDTCSEEAEQTADSCTELLLAFNIQFKNPPENIIMKALMSRNTAEEFLRKLIVLANREDDPVGSMFEHIEPPPNSVHKMLLDIFSQQDTANLFYTNDLKVFIEIVARKLLDLSPDDKTQLAYLRLAYNIICNTNYVDYCHCQDEFQQCFQKILHEDTSSPEESKSIVRKLCKQLPASLNLKQEHQGDSN